MSTDVTVVVTAHDETAVCGPTMRAADLAVEAARSAGHTVQAVVALAAPTEATRTYFHQPRFDHWERRVLTEREPGRVCNALVPEAAGRFLTFLAADGLVSENWLVEGVRALAAAEERGERVIVHPELEIAFDGVRAVTVNIEQASPLFTPHCLAVHRLYGRTCLAPREAHLELPRATGDPSTGRDGGDAQWTIETMAAGWGHVVARDTLVLERRPDPALVAGGDPGEPFVPALPDLAVDRVRGLGRDRP